MFSLLFLYCALCIVFADDNLEEENVVDRPPRTCSQLNCGPNFKCFRAAPNRDARCVPTNKCPQIRCKIGQRCVNGGPGKDARCQHQTCQALKCFQKSQVCQRVRTGAYCCRPRFCSVLRCNARGQQCVPGRPGKDARCVAGCTTNEVWNRCGGCDSSCSEPYRICPGNCSRYNSRCRCKVGKIRGPSGQCINPSSCTNFIPMNFWYPRCTALNCGENQACYINGGQMTCRDIPGVGTDAMCYLCPLAYRCILRDFPCADPNNCPPGAVNGKVLGYSCAWEGMGVRCDQIRCQSRAECQNTAAGPKCIPNVLSRQQVTFDDAAFVGDASDAHVIPSDWKMYNNQTSDDL